MYLTQGLLDELWGVVLPGELLEPVELELSVLEPVLLLFKSELPALEPELVPPGLKAPPVAELLPESPKYEKTL